MTILALNAKFENFRYSAYLCHVIDRFLNEIDSEKRQGNHISSELHSEDELSDESMSPS